MTNAHRARTTTRIVSEGPQTVLDVGVADRFDLGRAGQHVGEFVGPHAQPVGPPAPGVSVLGDRAVEERDCSLAPEFLRADREAGGEWGSAACQVVVFVGEHEIRKH